MRGALEAARLREEKTRADAERVEKENEELKWRWNEDTMAWRRREGELQAQVHHLMQQLQAAYSVLTTLQSQAQAQAQAQSPSSSYSSPSSPSPRLQPHSPNISHNGLPPNFSHNPPAHVQALLASSYHLPPALQSENDYESGKQREGTAVAKANIPLIRLPRPGHRHHVGGRRRRDSASSSAQRIIRYGSGTSGKEDAGRVPSRMSERSDASASGGSYGVLSMSSLSSGKSEDETGGVIADGDSTLAEVTRGTKAGGEGNVGSRRTCARQLVLGPNSSSFERHSITTRGWVLTHSEHRENIDGYKPGGYHPVNLGDTFPSREIPSSPQARSGINVNGLARQGCLGISSHGVTLKIVIADLSSNNGESAILEWLSTRPRDHPGAKHIVQIQGPNGMHQVLVMDVLGSLYSLIPPRWLSSTMVEYIHFGNFGFKIPSINQYTEIEMYRLIREPKLIPVIPHYHWVPSNSLPKYLVAVPETAHFMPKVFAEILRDKLTVQIIDFGNGLSPFLGYYNGQLTLVNTSISITGWKTSEASRHVPRTIRPPELTFYELSGGQVKMNMGDRVFRCDARKSSDDDNRLIYETMKLVGPLPERWKPYWDSKCFEDWYSYVVVVDCITDSGNVSVLQVRMSKTPSFKEVTFAGILIRVKI
ncbi:hypothetical protein DFJ58DRAFT_841746 [Suillus subalutaceus]|uniref:uncharacterized protein n=1 Tax=Suillus subalutaceus TaxID=48586 RepID=UPI001B86B25D|nr:uncharacterized protein DFJ58DRAFT_841746 [Suillus subalutaceus]KAG1852848.1 hypothetical protein DFJ58DRAFT_841746 [Suillus subalutaceus]